jgi:hypothetical protein
MNMNQIALSIESEEKKKGTVKVDLRRRGQGAEFSQ